MVLGRGGRPLVIGYGRIFHEANVHSPLLTERSAFERMQLCEGDELEARTRLGGKELAAFMPHAELKGFRQAALLAGGVRTVPLLSAMAMSSGPLSRACFDELVARLVERIRSAPELDGVMLALHGAMQVDGLGSAPEGAILDAVRKATNAKIAVTYDLHANFSRGHLADLVFAYRTNPHWDLAPSGFRAGNRLIRMLRGGIRPVHAWRKLPLVLGGGTTIDFLSPMRSVFSFMRKLERDPRVLGASVFMMHPYVSAERIGWAVHVMTDGDEALARDRADALADKAWAQRTIPPPAMMSVGEAIDRASKRRKLGPVTFVDVDDIVGAGAPGGNTRIALALRDRDLRAYVPVHDPALVAEVWDRPIGSRASVTLRGTPGYGSPPVDLDVVIGARATTISGRTVRLDSGAMRVAVTDEPPLPIHPSFWSALDLSARKADVLVQKNFFHYRLFYATISFAHFPVVSDGATSFKRVPRFATGEEPSDWRQYDALVRAG